MRRVRAARLLMVASGFAGLGYQIVWTQQCALWLGHEAAAVLAVVAAFFGGLAAGAFALGGRVARSARPRRWYVGCELTIAAWSLALVFVMRPFSAAALRLTGAEPSATWQWAVAFVGTFALFLPATAAMGATLPAMERLAARDDGRGVAGLYAANTFGAVVGVLASAFALVPGLGLSRTAGLGVALNLACALAVRAIFPATIASEESKAPAPASSDARALLATLGVTGLLGLGFEVLVVRVLSQVTEDTVYSFALSLAVYLVGSAAGAAAYQRWLVARRDRGTLGDELLGALAVACLLGTASLWAADATRAFALHALGGGMPAAIAAEALLAVTAFGPATIVMGALFSHLAGRAIAGGVSLGTALGVNTLGAAVAPALWGVAVVPALGPKRALLLIAAGYLALVARRAWRRPIVWAPALGALALAAFAPPLVFVDVPPGGRVVSYREGVMAAVSVVEDADGVARLRINDRQQEGSSATYHVDARQAWLPLLLHPAPARALFLGLGTGVTASAATEDPRVRVEAVELLPEVIEASSVFRPTADGSLDRLHVVAADARRFVRESDARYDVIVADNFHPARSGSGALYTVEHFEAVRTRLAAGGVFCQWLPLHQLDLDTLRIIARSFLTAFPDGAAILASNSLETPVIGLVGRDAARAFDLAALRARLSAGLPTRAATLGFDDELAVLGAFVAGPEALRRFAGDAPLNTDDRPVVAYRAPRVTYAPDSLPRDRLLAFLGEVAGRGAPPALAPDDPAFARRLAAYEAARDRFLRSGRDVRPSGDVRAMLAQVQAPLLAVLRKSPDFRPAYDPLIAMAGALAPIDPAAARVLLSELARVQPARTEAARLLASLDAR
ncbi:MAG TPA: MnmC family methyltransferase [Polyangia bacterium]|nr:MnmC family methyltransferase [Polyangia bacterium]